MTDINDLVFKQTIVDDNYQLAMDTIPESFIPVKMLYINGKINNKDLNIFIDTNIQPKPHASISISSGPFFVIYTRSNSSCE